VDRLDAAYRAELDALLGDLGRREAGVAQCELVTDEAGQERGLAGDELRQSARMRGRELEAGPRGVVEVDERRPTAEVAELGVPATPARFRDVPCDDRWVADGDRVRGRGVASRIRRPGARGGRGLGPFVGELVPVVPIEPLHIDTIRRTGRIPRSIAASRGISIPAGY
jgi:hypothetical protein